MQSLDGASETSLVTCEVVTHIHVDNCFRTQSSGVTTLNVWGGCVANCGEDSLARTVAENAHSLQSVLYCPDRTKGGALIRPGYHRGDRSFKMCFPELTDLTIRLEPMLLPIEYGWITPELKHLRLLCVVSRNDQPQQPVSLPRQQSLLKWTHEDRNRQAVLRDCPKLESIKIAVCSTKDNDCMPTDWIELMPPGKGPVSWSVHRLLILPIRKPVADDDVGNPKQFISPLSSLSVHIIQLISSFLSRAEWARRVHQLPESDIERLGLPQGFPNDYQL